jgi:hypothetical protein
VRENRKRRKKTNSKRVWEEAKRCGCYKCAHFTKVMVPNRPGKGGTPNSLANLRWENKSEQQKKAQKEKTHKTWKKKPVAEKKKHSERISKSQKERWANMPEDVYKELQQTHVEAWVRVLIVRCGRCVCILVERWRVTYMCI